jgi:hypothetical protein
VQTDGLVALKKRPAGLRTRLHIVTGGERLLFLMTQKEKVKFSFEISKMLATEKAGIVYFEFVLYKNSAKGTERGQIC